MEEESQFLNKEEINEAFFQFNDDEPIQFAQVIGKELTFRLIAEETSNPTMTFNDGKGNQFSIFLRKRDELQS